MRLFGTICGGIETTDRAFFVFLPPFDRSARQNTRNMSAAVSSLAASAAVGNMSASVAVGSMSASAKLRA